MPPASLSSFGTGSTLICSPNDVYARRFAADGTSQGEDFLVNEALAAFAESRNCADVALADDGSFVVVWQHDNCFSTIDVMARRFDSTGEPRVASFLSQVPVRRIPPDRAFPWAATASMS